MRSRLVAAPWWVLSLITGTFFGIFMAVFTRVSDPEAYGGAAGFIISAIVAGLVFGLAMGPILARTNDRARAAADVDDPHEMVEVARAAGRGPVPTDPRRRAAARNLAAYRLDELRRKRNLNLTFFGLASLAYLAMAIFSSPWWWLAVLMFTGFLIYTLILPGRLERRISLLSDQPPTAASRSSS